MCCPPDTSAPTVQKRQRKSGLHGQEDAKNTSKEKQQAEEIYLGQETQGMDIRPVEICALV